jgi:hypothetical protein
MKALDFVVRLRPAVPMSLERPCREASNSEIRRWLDGGMIEINGGRPKAMDKLNFPIKSLVLFPKSKSRKCTLV